MKKLNESNVTLTKLEVKTLECILSQGSFYEESQYEDIEKMKSCFFGWEITEKEVKGCDGALASLVKKGIISVIKDCDGVAYYTNYAFKFDESKERYHALDLTGITVR